MDDLTRLKIVFHAHAPDSAYFERKKTLAAALDSVQSGLVRLADDKPVCTNALKQVDRFADSLKGSCFKPIFRQAADVADSIDPSAVLYVDVVRAGSRSAEVLYNELFHRICVFEQQNALKPKTELSFDVMPA